MTEQVTAPALPGAVGITHLKVYNTRAPDGLLGGSRTCTLHVLKRIWL